MTKLDLNAMTMISGGGGAQASNGGVAINGNGNVVHYGNTANNSSNSGSSKKS
ncbi:MAG: hypothetical protein K2Y56_06410 [Methylobacterium sp.]|uniref:hypothetical protein n=1 Tax=Methylobacterium sp. TaxID=409 RepID=UPI0025DBE334|nr:hypothetical protein [Methylobacterium sp.]MBX9931156.1 hypothetical protein [Methylobacterium sp.]